MLTHNRVPVCLSLVSTDLPVWTVVEAAATLYQKDHQRFHLLLSEPGIPASADGGTEAESLLDSPSPRLLWLELSPYRVIMTMQGNGRFSYRHFWEQGVYGLSRYWLQTESHGTMGQLRLQNFTRNLHLHRNPLPTHLRIDYELWSEKVQLGRYVLNLEIRHP